MGGNQTADKQKEELFAAFQDEQGYLCWSQLHKEHIKDYNNFMEIVNYCTDNDISKLHDKGYYYNGIGFNKISLQENNYVLTSSNLTYNIFVYINNIKKHKLYMNLLKKENDEEYHLIEKLHIPYKPISTIDTKITEIFTGGTKKLKPKKLLNKLSKTTNIWKK
jgi:hypothetical protein